MLSLLIVALLPVVASASHTSLSSIPTSPSRSFATADATYAASPILFTASGTKDSDNDGLSDDDEEALGTDPNNPDTDGDGLQDGVEVKKYKTSPLKPDTDGDGLSDGDEVLKYFTDPLVADTDGDGLSDGDEVITWHTDPKLPDTDGDGLSDSEEVLTFHTDPLKPDTDGDGLLDGDEVHRYRTNPLKADTDGDGLSDGDEVLKYHTDPLKIDTDGDGVSDFDEVTDIHTNPLNPDTDGDGFNDKDDACPKAVGIKETKGCPLQVGDTLTFGGLVFSEGGSQIEVASIATLSRIVTILKQFPQITATLEMYVEPTNNPRRDVQLSGARSNNIVTWLISHGIPEKQLEHQGVGLISSKSTAHLDLIVLKRRD